jgi:hypothetical protein
VEPVFVPEDPVVAFNRFFIWPVTLPPDPEVEEVPEELEDFTRPAAAAKAVLTLPLDPEGGGMRPRAVLPET